jgi:uncharacterized protein GlcG (DUF336 family)
MYERKVLGLEEVFKAVHAMIEAVPSGSRPISIAVTDDRGDLICLARMDKAHGFTNEMAMRKAYTSARRRIDTSKLGRHLRESGWGIEDIGPNYTAIPGGIAIVKPDEDTVYGSIGVSGRIPASEDEEIALIGLKTLQDVLWPSK